MPIPRYNPPGRRYTNVGGNIPVYRGTLGDPGHVMTYEQRIAAGSRGFDYGGSRTAPGFSYGPVDVPPADTSGNFSGYSGGYSPFGPYRYGINPSGPAFADPFQAGFAYTGPGYQTSPSGGGGGVPSVEVNAGDYGHGSIYDTIEAGGSPGSPSDYGPNRGADQVGGPTGYSGGIPDNPFGDSNNPFSNPSLTNWNYYDAGNGISYIYDQDWNYIGTQNTPQQQGNPFEGAVAGGTTGGGVFGGAVAGGTVGGATPFQSLFGAPVGGTSAHTVVHSDADQGSGYNGPPDSNATPNIHDPSFGLEQADQSGALLDLMRQYNVGNVADLHALVRSGAIHKGTIQSATAPSYSTGGRLPVMSK